MSDCERRDSRGKWRLGKQGSTTTPRRARACQRIAREGAGGLDDDQSTDEEKSPGVREDLSNVADDPQGHGE